MENRIPIIANLLISFLFLHDYVPYIGYKCPSFLFAFVVIALLFMMISLLKKELSSVFTRILPIVLLPSILYLVEVFVKGTDLFTTLYFICQLTLYPLVGYYIYLKGNEKDIKYFTILILSSFSVTALTTWLGCLSIPGISRVLASSDNLEASGMKDIVGNYNIGGFGLIYQITLLTPLLLMMIKNKTLNRLLICAIIVLYLFTLIEAEYTTALLVFIPSLLLVLVPQNFGRKEFLRFSIIAILLVVILRGVFLIMISEFIDILGDGIVAERLIDLQSALSGSEHNISESSDFNIRKTLFDMSYSAFVNNPLGTWNSSEVGGHSFVLDTLGELGLLSIPLIYVMFKKIYQYYVGVHSASKYFGYPLFVFIISIVFAIVNPQVFIPFTTFVVPIICKYNSLKLSLN